MHENLPEQIAEFKSGFWPRTPLYLDEDKALFRAVGDGTIRKVRPHFVFTHRPALTGDGHTGAANNGSLRQLATGSCWLLAAGSWPSQQTCYTTAAVLLHKAADG